MAQLMPLRVLGPRRRGQLLRRPAGAAPRGAAAQRLRRRARRAAPTSPTSASVAWAMPATPAPPEVIAQARAQGTMIVAAAGNESAPRRRPHRLDRLPGELQRRAGRHRDQRPARRGLLRQRRQRAGAGRSGRRHARADHRQRPARRHLQHARHLRRRRCTRARPTAQHQGTSMATPHVAGGAGADALGAPGHRRPLRSTRCCSQGRLSDDQGDGGHDADYRLGHRQRREGGARGAGARRAGARFPRCEGVRRGAAVVAGLRHRRAPAWSSSLRATASHRRDRRDGGRRRQRRRHLSKPSRWIRRDRPLPRHGRPRRQSPPGSTRRR
ncbi:MAG: hypothetical protein MZW92_34835 [Comamonadaceae bacterium]|nr:hypothetical protein [Comamonadaceae bacterium]